MNQSLSEQLVSQTVAYAGKVPAVILTLVIGIIVLRLVKMVVRRGVRLGRLEPTLATLVESLVGFTGWVIILAALASVLGLQQLSLALGGSLALVAMALAAGVNSITQDLMAGIFLIADEDFRVGVRVKTGSLEGTIERVTIRKTKIRDDGGLLHTVPNRMIDGATYIITGGPGVKKEAEEKATGASV